MKRYILMAIAFAVVLSVSIFVGARREPARQSVAQADTRIVTIPVEGMVCLACTARVKSTLKAINGVAEVEVSLEERVARVKYVPGKVTPDQLVATVNRLGYRAGTPQTEKTK